MNNSVRGFKINKKIVVAGILALCLLFSFNSIVVYNEAGYQTHVRTILGEEKVLTDVGYGTKWFGRATAWRQVLTVPFIIGEDNDVSGSDGIVVNDYKIVFLGNVDGDVEASTRFRLPQGESFLKIAREYRTPENFMMTAVVPAVKETLQNTASLMTADDYFAGSRSEFGSEFDSQLKLGQYITKRKEVIVSDVRGRNQSSALKSGGDLHGFDEGTKRSMFVVEKLKDSTGKEIRKPQQFIELGVEVVEARITNIKPNEAFLGRMVKVQQAQAELAVARQDRLKEEEQKLLVIAQGEKAVEQKRQETLRDQIEKTTNAETSKQLALIAAAQQKESAKINEETSLILLDKAIIDAKSIKTTADAEAYQKRVLIEADGALAQKLEAFVAVNAVWAKAATTAPVPSVVMGGNDGSTGRQSEVGAFMDLMTVQAAKQLNLDMKVK